MSDLQLIIQHLNDVKLLRAEFPLIPSQTDDLADLISGHNFNTSVGSLSFDKYGERIIQFDVRQMDPSTGAFIVGNQSEDMMFCIIFKIFQ